MNYFMERLNEPSTWRGLIMLGTALGLTVSPETAAQVVAVGTGLAGLVGTLTRG
ncbi:MAG: hypothetical protein HQL82_09945 [Magnetococcales bacterium]|nr:hypothetical protein [Magnetococcales bacterium]